MIGSPVFRIVAAMLVCTITFSLYTAPSDAGRSPVREISLVQLLSSPTQYNGNVVAVRGYLGRGGSPGTLYATRELAGDPRNGIELLDHAAARALSSNAQLRACLKNTDVEVTGTFSEIRPGEYAVLSVEGMHAMRGSAACRWARAG